MTDAANNTATEDSKSKKPGCFGFFIGCLIIIIAIMTVIFFIFIKPALDDAGYTYDDTMDAGDEIYQKSKEKYQDLKEKYQDLKEKVGAKSDDLKENTAEKLDDLKELDDNAREELDKAAPKLIAD